MKTRVVASALFALAILSAHLGAAVPNAPRSLDIVVHENTVTLTWSAPLGGDAPTGYFIRASLSPGGPIIASFPTTNTTEVITNVPMGVYYVHILAMNADGTSVPSNEVIASVPGGTGGCTTRPEMPTDFSATVAAGEVTLSWTPPSTGCAPTGYVIQAGSATGLSDLAILNVTNMSTLSVMAPPGTYFVRVIATNAFGGSTPSAEIVVTVGP